MDKKFVIKRQGVEVTNFPEDFDPFWFFWFGVWAGAWLVYTVLFLMDLLSGSRE